MSSISGRDLCKALERNGWELKRIHGSHHIYGKSGTVVRLSVPVHGATPLKIGLLRALLKSAGLGEGDCR
jgi:predicted RNA binding protein YcfA (HicA-like mRNA interferase family)